MTNRRSTPRIRPFRASALGAAAFAAAALPSSAAAGPGSGLGSLVWLAAAVVAIVLVFVLVRLLGGLRRARHTISDISDGRELLIARGRRVTAELTELADDVDERDDEAATRQHQRALEAVSSARGRIGRAPGPRVQSKAHDELDEAEWLIGVLRARLDGFVEPLKPRNGLPVTCFFDGAHGLATVEVDLEGIAMQRIPVRSCAACAVLLVRGERPRVGSVPIGGRSVPWPAAPRWCGSYAWAPKDLRHLHYDGMALFAGPERPVAQRRQTVAERARGVRARVLPVAPELLPEDEADELPGEFEAFAVETPEAERGEQEPLETSAVSSGAFAAMESEAPGEIETSPVAASDTPQE